ncbi:MAG: type 1 glutamine amidotransferase [Bacillati bacterium ANGP1]|uniref:Type 1 glutamine amidotransferase n=1 Tax=Candidatus Segetimicrobium genomatis TaxID=2569760 RepID=A0A537KCY6_9BACT|nr:MAG: type 1 glutamine amidotransferase [Terrabacteria group bacterium ANGP1]
MELTGKRVAVLAEDHYENLELWYPVLRLREAGAQVTIVGPKAGESYKSKEGYPAKADLSMDDARAADFDAVIVPGGYAPDRMRRHQAMLTLVREAFQSGKVVAAICHAGWVPISAGIVKGKTMTCVSAIKDDVINAGAKYVDREVVVDGNLISSRTPPDLPAFCREIVKALSGAKVAARA